MDPDLVDGMQALVQRWHLAAVHEELLALLTVVGPETARTVVPSELERALAAAVDSYGQPETSLNSEQRSTLSRLAHEEMTIVEEVAQRALGGYVAARDREMPPTWRSRASLTSSSVSVR